MKKLLFLLIFFSFLFLFTGCVSKSSICGNWASPSDSSKMIYTDSYALIIRLPVGDRGIYIGKHSYQVENYGLFLRSRKAGLTDNVISFFGLKIMDHTRYWFGFIPILGFQFSYKVSDKTMLDFLRKNRVSYEKVLNLPISTPGGKVPGSSVPDSSIFDVSVPDRSVPPIFEQLRVLEECK